MRKLVIITAAAILAMFGLVHPAAASGHIDSTDAEDCTDGDPDGVDISSLSALAVGGATNTITVTMLLCDPTIARARYRVHFDHTAPFASDGPTVSPVCQTTSDDTSKRTLHHKKGTTDTGPGTISGTTTLIYTVSYADLGLVGDGNDDVEIWADTHKKGIQDRAPNTSTGGADSCSKPESDNEVLQITAPASTS